MAIQAAPPARAETADDRIVAQAGPAEPPLSRSTKDFDAANPEDGSVSNSYYYNPYFGLSVPLPTGWSEGLAGPPPSNSGTYVLASLDGTRVDAATILIVAQDLFFSAKPFANAAAAAADFRESIAAMPNMTIDAAPSVTSVGNSTVLRLNYNAGGLFRAWLATELRCHVVTFNVTGTDKARVDNITRGLDVMTLPAAATPAPAELDGEPTPPICIKDYVTPQTLLRKVDPIAIDYRGQKLPVRIIIGTDGRVRHVHVISADAAQRRAITEALLQWQFTPLNAAGHPSAVETGLVFENKPHGP